MIYGDPNERRSDVEHWLDTLKQPIDWRPLKFCDYACGDIEEYEDATGAKQWRLIGVPVERKTADDYIKSKKSEDHHLDKQLYELSYNSPLSYLVIIGNVMEALMMNDMSQVEYISSYVGSSYKRAPDGCQGIVITNNVFDTYQFCLFLKYLDIKIQKDEPRLPIFAKKAQASPQQSLVRTLSGFPGVGQKTAQSILNDLDSITNFATAPLEVLLKVEGLGPKKARELYAYCRMGYKAIEDRY